MVLLEVLIAVGLLGVVASCLLTAFQQTRRADEQLRGDLGRIRQHEQLRGFLEADLMRARAVLLSGLDQQPGRVLQLLCVSEPGMEQLSGPVLIEYGWDAGREVVLRTVHSQGRELSRMEVKGGTLVQFAPELDSPTEGPEVIAGGHLRPTERGRRMRSLRVTRSAPRVGAGSRASDPGGDIAEAADFTIYMPVPLPVVEPGEVRP